MAGSEVYFSGGPWLEAFIGSAPGQQRHIKTEHAMADNRLTLFQQNSDDIDMAVPNCLDESGDSGVIWRMCDVSCVQNRERKNRTLELDIEGSGLCKEFICPLEITVSTSLPESRHHFVRNARVKRETKKIKFK